MAVIRPPWPGRAPDLPACPGVSGRVQPASRKRPDWQIRGQIGAHPTGRYSTITYRIRPGKTSCGKQHKSHRVRLDHVRRGPPGVSRSFYALNRTIRRNSQLDRTARRPFSYPCEQRANGIPQHGPIHIAARVKSRNSAGHSIGISTTNGHDRTIRLDRRTQSGAPGSRKALWTRHSSLRCIPRVSGCVEFSKGAWA
jgi:hypothetical protein